MEEGYQMFSVVLKRTTVLFSLFSFSIVSSKKKSNNIFRPQVIQVTHALPREYSVIFTLIKLASMQKRT